MKLYRFIFIFVLCSLFAVPTWAKKQSEPKVPIQTVTVEQEQQFKYYWYAAKQALVEERYSDAYILLTFCNAINPNDGTTLWLLGIIEEELGNHLKSILLYRDAFKADPYDQWYPYFNALVEIGNMTAMREAEKVLEKAHEVQLQSKDPVDENLLDALRRLYIAFEEWKKALGIQDELEALQGYDESNAYYRYSILTGWGKKKEAVQAIERYLDLNPSGMEELPLMILNNYAYYTATHKGDLQKAEKMSAITISKSPTNSSYLDTYGWILHLQGQDELAFFYLKKAQLNATGEHKKEIEQHLKVVQKKVKIYER